MALIVQTDKLTPRTADELIVDFLGYAHGALPGDDLEVDLGALHFIDPYGLLALCLLARYGRILSARVAFHLPQAYALRTYLGRVRFAEAVDGIDLKGPTLVVDQEREKTASETLLEITRIEERVDVEAVLGKIGQRVEAILAEELRYTEVEINQFKNVVAELCHNILDHSENWGYLTAQRYVDSRAGKKYVVIGVGDLGIGIKKSLSVRYESAEWSHGEAILNSLKKHFSRDTTRGLGLYIVNQICNRYNGSLHIRSGDTRVYIRGQRHWEHVSTHFPGTQIAIALYQRDGG
ncbi:MAG: ATP-binding protein [Candidatus Latescibacterota bacterium]|nr:ATP-binding protein [Candidatus Latescibacterota bacterium]